MENLSGPLRATVAGIVIVLALGLVGLGCQPRADSRVTLPPVAAVGLAAMSGRAFSLDETAATVDGRFIALSVGADHNCALREDGRALCWGRDDQRQSSPPIDERFVAISVGTSHTCGLRADGASLCWGRWRLEGPTAHSMPAERFVAISSGGNHACGLRDDGTAVCWGVYPGGNLGQWSPAGERFAAIFSQSSPATCGIKADGAALCWVNNLADPPWRPNNEGNLASLSRSRGCGLKRSGQVICPQPQSDDSFPSPSPGGRLRFMGSSWDGGDRGFVCGIRIDGTGACWPVRQGSNQEWNLPELRLSQRFLDIGAGHDHACGLLADGSITCWGRNRDGQALPPPTQPGPPPAPPTDVICNPGLVIVKGAACRLPKTIQAEVRRFTVTPDGLGVVYDEADEIYETRYGSIGISFTGPPVGVDDGWFRLERYSGETPCEGAGTAFDLFSRYQGFSDRPSGSRGPASALPQPLATCIVLAARAKANGDWVVDKALVWEPSR